LVEGGRTSRVVGFINDPTRLVANSRGLHRTGCGASGR
jgi:hypothetical protein